MCEFCELFNSSKKNGIGKMIHINEKSDSPTLREAQIIKFRDDEKASLIIYTFSGLGYFEIEYCPMCGRKLVEE